MTDNTIGSSMVCLNDKHAPDMEKLKFNRYGRTTHCKVCGTKLLLYKLVEINHDPEKSKKHQSKKDRLRAR